jgi:hypothetical protein
VLLANDELRHEMQTGAVFTNFQEGDIAFSPTFKVERSPGLHYLRQVCVSLLYCRLLHPYVFFRRQEIVRMLEQTRVVCVCVCEADGEVYRLGSAWYPTDTRRSLQPMLCSGCPHTAIAYCGTRSPRCGTAWRAWSTRPPRTSRRVTTSPCTRPSCLSMGGMWWSEQNAWYTRVLLAYVLAIVSKNHPFHNRCRTTGLFLFAPTLLSLWAKVDRRHIIAR